MKAKKLWRRGRLRQVAAGAWCWVFEHDFASWGGWDEGIRSRSCERGCGEVEMERRVTQLHSEPFERQLVETWGCGVDPDGGWSWWAGVGGEMCVGHDENLLSAQMAASVASNALIRRQVKAGRIRLVEP